MYLVINTEVILLIDKEKSANYSEAMMGPNSNGWLEAMNSEIYSNAENLVWSLIDLLDGVKPIGYKWIFKRRRIWKVVPYSQGQTCSQKE